MIHAPGAGSPLDRSGQIIDRSTHGALMRGKFCATLRAESAAHTAPFARGRDFASKAGLRVR
jgi:hypothetical protein